MDLTNSMYIIFIKRKYLFVLKLGNTIKKPIINEKIIEKIEIRTVTENPLIKKDIFVDPVSRNGFKTYHPQV